MERSVKKKKPGDNWRNHSKKGRCAAHGRKNPCFQCRKDTIAREQYMAQQRTLLNEQLFPQRDL